MIESPRPDPWNRGCGRAKCSGDYSSIITIRERFLAPPRHIRLHIGHERQLSGTERTFARRRKQFNHGLKRLAIRQRTQERLEMKSMVTAIEMAHARNINPKTFRCALRAADFKWHSHNDRWEVSIGSPEYHDMQRVLLELVNSSPKHSKSDDKGSTREQSTLRTASDEAWIIDICDKILGRQAIRQHRFPFLCGDAGQSGRRVRLPVDA